MAIDGGALRLLREQRFGNIRTFARASGLATDTITAIENGFKTVRQSSLARYCATIEVNALDYIIEPSPTGTTRVFKIAKPRKVDFRPAQRPDRQRTDWRNSQTVVSLLPLDITLNPHFQYKECIINHVSITSNVIDETVGRTVRFDWAYWISLDSTRDTDLDQSLTNERAWRGEVSREGGGSQVRPRLLRPGGSDTHELMFRSHDAPPWSTLVAKLVNLVEATASVELQVRFTYLERGRLERGQQSETFSLLRSCISSLISRGFEKGKFRHPSFIEPRVLGGAYEKCGFDCCDVVPQRTPV